MFPVFILCLCVNLSYSYTVFADIATNVWPDQDFDIAHADQSFIEDKDFFTDKKEVKIQLYYESFCPGCMEFETTEFKEVVEKLHEYIDIQTYPYGNAKTYERDGRIEFECQHGPDECYGNKLHACALNIIQNHTTALLFNSCMMDKSHRDGGSNDRAASKCGSKMAIDSKPIKACAKMAKGSELLKYYGEETAKAKIIHVPYILINGHLYMIGNFLKVVCTYFSKPPPPCNEV